MLWHENSWGIRPEFEFFHLSLPDSQLQEHQQNSFDAKLMELDAYMKSSLQLRFRICTKNVVF